VLFKAKAKAGTFSGQGQFCKGGDTGTLTGSMPSLANILTQTDAKNMRCINTVSK